MRTSNLFTKRAAAYLFWAFVIALTVNAFRIQGPTLKAAVLPPKAVPYTVVLQEFRLQRDGTAVPSFRLTQAIRGDGSRASEMTSSNAASPSSERVLDFSSGKQMYVFSPRQLKTTMFDPAKNQAANWVRDSGTSCLFPGSTPSESPKGEEDINEYRSVKIEVNANITQWLALDYGCALIKERAEWPDGQMSEKRLIALTPGEPSPSLFEDPAGFQEVPPSRWLPSSPSAGREDAYYQSHRPPDGAPRPQ